MRERCTGAQNVGSGHRDRRRFEHTAEWRVAVSWPNSVRGDGPITSVVRPERGVVGGTGTSAEEGALLDALFGLRFGDRLPLRDLGALGVFHTARMPIQTHSVWRSFVTPGVERIHRSSSF